MFSLEHFSNLEITQTQVCKTYPDSKQMKIGKQIEMKEEGAEDRRDTWCKIVKWIEGEERW